MSKLNLVDLNGDPLNQFFPEEFYPPTSDNYGEMVSRGLQIASGLNVLFCGVVRDADFILNRNIECLRYMGRFFRESYIYIYENDSQDSTKKILEQYRNTPYITYKTEKKKTKKLADTSLERRRNMANARNNYLEFAKKTMYHHDYDLVIVVDLDLYGWSYTGLLHSIASKQEYDCIGSNSILYRNNQRLFYDTWAYKGYQEQSEEEKNLLRFNRGDPLIPVVSCFGGMMIYPASILRHDIKYQDYHCDHVTLNQQLIGQGYNIYLNPSQITLYSKHYYVNNSS